MRSFGGILSLALLVGVLGASCSTSVSPNGPYACGSGEGCPSGYTCVSDRCVRDDGTFPDAPIGSRADGPLGDPPDANAPLPCQGEIGPVGQCFEAFNNPLSQNQSQRACEQRGGHLATVTDGPELAAMDGELDGGAGWIGLEGNDGVFTWITGEPFAFASWIPGEPDPAFSSACVQATALGWRVATCNSRFPYVCERP